MDLSLAGKIVLVTAASRGLGYAIAEAFLVEGATAIISARNQDTLDAAAAKLKEETGKGSKESFSIYTPLVRTRYDLTPKTNLQLGFQGFPFWRYRKLDRADKLEGYKEWNLVLMASNQSDHYGYNLASQFGFLKVSREYEDESRSGDDFDTSTLFFDVIAGF